LSSLKGSCVVRLLDSRGRALTQLKAEGGQGLSLDVLGYAAGVYVIEIHNGENNYRQRLILRP
jgi:hypothetical protein